MNVVFPKIGGMPGGLNCESVLYHLELEWNVILNS